MKDIAFQLLLIFGFHSNTTSKFAGSMWKWTTCSDNPDPKRTEFLTFIFDPERSNQYL